MTHPMQGCIERLDRAERHLHAFKVAVATPEAHKDVADLVLKHNLDLERKQVTIVPSRDVVLPTFLGVIFGDVIHNLHATLDNLAHELSRLHLNKPPRTVEFPILESADEWLSEDTRRKLAGISAQDRARIESHQPFMEHNGVAAKHQVLARLRRYSNEGKHRVVTPIGGVSMDMVAESIHTVDLNITSHEWVLNKPLRKDAVLARFGVEVTGPNPAVKMQGDYTWYPALDNGDPAEKFLGLAFLYVHDLVVEFGNASFGGLPQSEAPISAQ